MSTSSNAPERALRPPSAPATPTDRPAIDNRVYAGFPTTDADEVPLVTTPLSRAAQRPERADTPEPVAIEADSGQLRRVLFGGSLVVSLALGAVVLASSRGNSDADATGQSDPLGSSVSGDPTTEAEPTELAPSATAVIEPASPEIVTPDIVSGSTPVVVAESETAPSATDVADPQPAAVTPISPDDVSSSSVPAAEVEGSAVVEESSGVVRNGQIFLTGAVPTVESGERIAGLAAAILGPDNVINNYVIDSRASDPNLGNLTVEDTINFSSGSTEILPGSETLLNQGLALLTIRPAMTVTIVGHTDSRGTELSNQELSLGRAQNVKQWFVDRGVSADRFTVVGAGASEPLADNETVDGRRLNRRIQFFLENLLV